MKAIALAMLMVLLVTAPVSAAKKPHKIGLENPSCLYTNINGDGYSVLVTGDLRDGAFDYANNPEFIDYWTTQLETFSGAMGFYTTAVPGAYWSRGYPDGVWFRWHDYPKHVTYLPVPDPCDG